MNNPEGGHAPDETSDAEGHNQEQLSPLFTFIETPELATIRARAVDTLVEAGADNVTPAVQEVMTEYQLQAERIINLLTGEAYKRALLGLMITKALLYWEAEWYDAERQEIKTAWQMAVNEGWDQEFDQLLIELGYPAGEDEHD
jgi:hypothetical protein